MGREWGIGVGAGGGALDTAMEEGVEWRRARREAWVGAYRYFFNLKHYLTVRQKTPA